MKKIISLLALVSASSFAWDGQREGFLLGIGAGAASAAYSFDGAEDDMDASMVQWIAPMTASRIGYAWSNTAAVELYSNSVGSGGAGYIGYTALNYHHWTSPEVNANSWFGGIGMLSETNGITYKDFDSKPADIGFGLNIGYGREIASHASIELNLFVGSLTDENYYTDYPEGTSWEKGGSSNSNVFAAFSVSMNLLGY